MNTESFTRTRHEWLAELGSKSELIDRLSIQREVPDSGYKEKNGDAANAVAFNLANSSPHTALIVETLEALHENGASIDTVRKFLVDLTSQNTYGTFSELSAYRFLQKGKIPFDIQAPMEGTQILNSNGSDLDGVLRFEQDVYFDVKGFGFLDYFVNTLTTRLSRDLAPYVVVAEGSWDVSVDALNDLLGKQYKALVEELRKDRKATRSAIQFSVRQPTRIQMTTREHDPAAAALENGDYVFRFAKQFCRYEPFFLIFVLHPWLSGTRHVNFDNSLDEFTSEFAKQAFGDDQSDERLVFGLPRAEAARLLSGILFIDAWELPPQPKGPRHRLFLNPTATNQPTAASVASLTAAYGSDIVVR